MTEGRVKTPGPFYQVTKTIIYMSQKAAFKMGQIMDLLLRNFSISSISSIDDGVKIHEKELDLQSLEMLVSVGRFADVTVKRSGTGVTAIIKLKP